MEFIVFWAILAPLVGWFYVRSRFDEIRERLDRLERLEKTVGTLHARVAEREAQTLRPAPSPATAGDEPVTPEPPGPHGVAPHPSTAPAPPVVPAPAPAFGATPWTTARVLSDFVLSVPAEGAPLAAAALAAAPPAPPAPVEAGAGPFGPPAAPPAVLAARAAGDPETASVRPRPDAGPSWEERIGGQWLTWLGAVTAVMAVGLGLKLAYDQGYLAWILELPPLAYLMLGWVLGGGFLATSLRLRGSMPGYAQGLAGGGIAILYLTTYAGHDLYGVLSAGTATVGLILVGAAAIALALRHDSVIIGWIGVILAYVSPVLLGGDGSSPAPLFLYLTGLNAAVVGISARRQWFRFRLAGFLATALLFGLWYGRSYTVLHFSAALMFVGVNSLLFVTALLLPALLRRERGGEADLAVAVLNPLLAELALYAILRGHAPDWQGGVALGFAAVYWLASRTLRARLQLAEGETDYLEQLFYSTALVLMLLAVPLQLKGRAMTAAWALIGAGLSWVGYRTAAGSLVWSRTRSWGAVALALAVGRLLLADAGRAPGTGAALVLNERGFSFAVVMACLAVPAALAAGEWKASERKNGSAEAVLTLLTLALCGLMDLWMALDLTSTWFPAGWSIVAALALAFGWQVKSIGVRVAGNLAAIPPLTVTLLEPITLVFTGIPTSLWPGWTAALLLAVGVSVAYLRTAEAAGRYLSPAYAAVSVILLFNRSGAELPAEWVPVAWSAIAGGAFALGIRVRSESHRRMGLFAAAVVVALVFGRAVQIVGNGEPVAPGFAAALLLSTGIAACFARGSWLSPSEQSVGVSLWAGVAAAVAMAWSSHALGRGWPPVVWLGVTLALLWAGVWTNRVDVRGLGLAVAALLTLEVALGEWRLDPGHLVLLHARTAAAWSAVGAWIACAVVLRRWGNEGERSLFPGTVVLANLIALAWCCTEAMNAASRLSPSGWSREAAQFGLSAAWALYAGGLIVTGLRRDLPGARWGGIGLILLAVLKVYLFDLGFLALGYRVLAFLVMAVVLLGVSYLYQRRAPTPG